MCRISIPFIERGFYLGGVTLLIFNQICVDPRKIYIPFSNISYNLNIGFSTNFGFFLLSNFPPCFAVIRHEIAINFSTLAFCKIFRWPNIGFSVVLFVTLRKMCPYSELFWSEFPRIWTEYGEIWSVSPYSARIRENADQNNSKHEDIIHSVSVWYFRI